jgi:hypothetical protein
MVSEKLSPAHAQFTPFNALAGVEARIFWPEPVTAVLTGTSDCFTAASFLQPPIINAAKQAGKISFLIDLR